MSSADDDLATRFEQDRAHLRAVAYRMLGSAAEADDAVQETWIRLHRSDTTDVRNLTGWLTTVVARVSLDMLRSRASRREDPLDVPSPRSSSEPPAGVQRTDPEQEAVLADSVGQALLVVLDTLDPAERLAFVLHDLFAVPFDEVATVVDRSPAAARQLASRARRRVQGSPSPSPDLPRQRAVVAAFLAASRSGDFAALLAVLDPDVVVRADAAAAQMGSSPLVSGAEAVARTFVGRAQAARPAVVDGFAGAVWTVRGKPVVVFDFVVEDGRVVELSLIADPARLAALDLGISPSGEGPAASG